MRLQRVRALFVRCGLIIILAAGFIVAPAYAAADYDAKEYRYMQSIADREGMVMVVATLNIPMSEVWNKMDPMTDALLAELGDDALKTGFRKSPVGQLTILVRPSGLEKLARSGYVKSIMRGSIQREITDYDQLDEIKQEIDEKNYADVEVVLNLDNLVFKYTADGETVYVLSPELQAEMAGFLPQFFAGLTPAQVLDLPEAQQAYQAKIQTGEVIEPRLTLRISREGFYRLQEYKLIRGLRSQARANKKISDTPQYFEIRALRHALKYGNASVWISLRESPAYSDFNLPEKARMAQTESLRQVLLDVLAPYGTGDLLHAATAFLGSSPSISVILSYNGLERFYRNKDPRVQRVDFYNESFPGYITGPIQYLNDTGQTGCYNGGPVLVACSRLDVDEFPGQDAQIGRDVAVVFNASKNGGGEAGFDFIKICNSGEIAGQDSCAANPTLGNQQNDWGCVLDTHTRLIWKVIPEAVTSWAAAMDAEYGPVLAAMSANSGRGLCNVRGWRLPAMRELMSIVHNGKGIGRPGAAVDSDYFPATPENGSAAQFWSRDRYPWNESVPFAFSVDFGSAGNSTNRPGSSWLTPAGSSRSVRLVSLEQSDAWVPKPYLYYKGEHFKDDIVYRDADVSDWVTGLSWAPCSIGQTDSDCRGDAALLAWQEALLAVREANRAAYLGYNDWRLPNKNELLSLLDLEEPNQSNPLAINPLFFQHTSRSPYWSSTSYAPGPSEAFVVGFYDGLVTTSNKAKRGPVRLVRGGNSVSRDMFVPLQSVFTVPDGRLIYSAEAIEIQGEVRGMNYIWTLKLLEPPPAGQQLFLLAYKPYEAVYDFPELWLQKTASDGWVPVTDAITPFMTVQGDEKSIMLLDKFDLFGLPGGSELYFGSGRDWSEMLEARRYRGILRLPG